MVSTRVLQRLPCYGLGVYVCTVIVLGHFGTFDLFEFRLPGLCLEETWGQCCLGGQLQLSNGTRQPSLRLAAGGAARLCWVAVIGNANYHNKGKSK